ncbi:PTS system mannose/fructose/sorbose family transporter subunit IID [Hominifimenecus sp. rT4P-3]|uniref:PTS system mannose/fructose/sorbose family transporter subunit IID n=1 Tax=Hominifimenecus sp. rT4P-3 TaxID=3242979 RepID=UPI003DA4FBB2
MAKTKEIKDLTKKDLFKTYLSYYTTNEMSNSYERLQNMNFCITMMPHLKKWYGEGTEEYKDALKRHLQFFNTECTIGGIIPGIVLSMEQKKAAGADIPEEAITGIKTGLMGPMAGIGDSLIRSTTKSTVLAIACTLALSGSVLGAFFPLIYPCIIIAVGFYMMTLGYNLGRDAVTKVLQSGLFKKIINATSVLAMFMMGALSSSYVKLKTPLSYQLENAAEAVEIQALLDKILPGILPLCCVFGVYFYLAKGGQKYSRIVWIMLAIALVGAFLGIFG